MTEFCERLDWVSVGLGAATYCVACVVAGFVKAAIRDHRGRQG
jgi:hypothetical protein